MVLVKAPLDWLTFDDCSEAEGWENIEVELKDHLRSYMRSWHEDSGAVPQVTFEEWTEEPQDK